MKKIGLVAGEGSLPIEFVKSAQEKGDKVVVYAIKGMASHELDNIADRVYWVSVEEIKKFIFLLIKERIRKLALLGKVNKSVVFRRQEKGKEPLPFIGKTNDKADYSLLEDITKKLKMIGVEVIKGTDYLEHLLAEKGILGQTLPDERIKNDIAFGIDVARRMANMDIGQTVIVKDKTIVAVEAMEGTDATIKRAKQLAGEGCVMVKMSRLNQDMRWDIPTVGSNTMLALISNKFSALAIESGKMFLVDKEKTIEMADSEGLVIEAI